MAAQDYLRLLETPREPAALRQAFGRARELAAPLTDDEQYRRWAWLLVRLHQAQAMLDAAGDGPQGASAVT